MPKLYLDNRRSRATSGSSQAWPATCSTGFIGEHLTGHYSKAHAHASSAVLVCINGKGYTYTWPRSIGMTPWKDGKADQVLPPGLRAGRDGDCRARIGGDWFHAHFGVSEEPLRLIGWYGPNNHRKDHKPACPAKSDTDEGAIDVTRRRHRDPVLDGGPLHPPGIRGDHLQEWRPLGDERNALRRLLENLRRRRL